MFYLLSFLFLAATTVFNLIFLSKLNLAKNDNLGFWFIFFITLKMVFFYLFLVYFLQVQYVFDFNSKLFICAIYMFFLILEVYYVSKLLKNQN